MLPGGVQDGSTNSSGDSDGEDKVDGGYAVLRLDDWILFRLDPDASGLVVRLRQKWNSLFLRRMRLPGKQCPQSDEATMRTIVAVLTNEERALGVPPQSVVVGQQPRPMSTEAVFSDADGGGRGGADYGENLQAYRLHEAPGRNNAGTSVTHGRAADYSSAKRSNFGRHGGSFSALPNQKPYWYGRGRAGPFPKGFAPRISTRGDAIVTQRSAADYSSKNSGAV